MDPEIRCPLCGGRLAVLAGPSRLSFFCEGSRDQFINHGDFVADASLPCRERLRASLERLLRAWEREAAELAAVGAGALRIGRREVGDTFGREAEDAATRTLLLRSFLATRGTKPPGAVLGAARPPATPGKAFSIGTSELRPGLGLVRVAGAVDYSNVAVLGAALEAFFRKRFFRLVLDLSEATYLASCALSLLLSALDRALQNSGGIALARASAPIRQVLDLLGLDGIFPLADDVPSAVSRLSPE